jgi:hypothetical protein
MEVVWERRYGLDGTDDRANAVERIFSGGYLVTGTTSSFGEDQDVWVLKMDEDGDTLWTLVWDSGGDDCGNAGYPLDDGFIITGSSEVGGASSAFLLRLGEEKPAVCESSTVRPLDLTVSFLRGSMLINYTLPHHANVSVSLYNAAGRRTITILDARQAPGTYSLNRDVSILPAGVYFLRLTAGNRNSTARVIVTP